MERNRLNFRTATGATELSPANSIDPPRGSPHNCAGTTSRKESPMLRLSAVLLAIFTATAPAKAATSSHHQLECPNIAPSSWNLHADARLVRSAILGARTGVMINDGAPPYLMPDQTYRRGGAWHNIWMLDDEPGWAYFVECQYLGSREVLRLGAAGLKQCEQVLRRNEDHPGADAPQTMACD